VSDQYITRPQGAPVKDTGAPSAHDLVIKDMEDRKAFGLQKYGTLLQHDNGRDHLVDAYQEVLDLAVYLRNEIERRKQAPVMHTCDEPGGSPATCTACRGTGHQLDADQCVAGLGPCRECGGLGVRLP
jgi:hypothetical protein